MDWWQVLGLLIGSPLAWEFLRWAWGFGRKKEYFDAAEAASIRNLERVSARMEKLETDLEESFEERKAQVKEGMKKDAAIGRLQIENERLQAEVARLRGQHD